MKGRTNASAIGTKGVRMDGCIAGAAGAPMRSVAAGWCKVFHHMTENLMTGKIIAPTRIRIAFLMVCRIAPSFYRFHVIECNEDEAFRSRAPFLITSADDGHWPSITSVSISTPAIRAWSSRTTTLCCGPCPRPTRHGSRNSQSRARLGEASERSCEDCARRLPHNRRKLHVEAPGRRAPA